MTNTADSPVTRMAEETAFISVWVIGAFLAYDYAAAYAGLDLEAMFGAVAPLLPLIAILIGMVITSVIAGVWLWRALASNDAASATAPAPVPRRPGPRRRPCPRRAGR